MKYVVMRTLRHDGEHYGRGDLVEMRPKVAAGLIAAGVLDGAPAPQTPPGTAGDNPPGMDGTTDGIDLDHLAGT